ncbi:MAG: hypothetical protein ABL999_02250 [Pyrinomonadaceae bacterium]
MRKLILRTALVCGCLAAFATGASGQVKKAAVVDGGSLAATVLKGTGKAAVIVVGSAGKAVWVTTKFTAKHVAWPVAKAVLLKAPEKMAVLGLKTAGFSLRNGIPAITKVGLAYLKAKIP